MSPTDAVINVLDALNKLRIPYMMVGSYSSNMWGSPRSTNDADMVLELGPDTINSLVKELSPELQLESQMTFETITSTHRHRLFLKGSIFKVELFFLGADPFDQARFARRVQRTVEGRPAYVASAEDVIIMKLRWSKGGRRAKDIADVQGVLKVRLRAGDLDVPYIQGWCDKHGTRELLEKTLLEVRGFLGLS